MIALLVLGCTPSPLDTAAPADTALPEEASATGRPPFARWEAPAASDTEAPQPPSCSDRAFSGPIRQARAEGGYQDNGVFWDLVIAPSGLWELDLQLPALGDEEVDCGYAGRASGQRISDKDSALSWLEGDALVYSRSDDDRCAVGLQSLQLHLAAPADCASIQGIYLHDITQPTGQGTLSMGASYALEEVQDDPETALPALGPGDCPIDTEMVFRGAMKTLNNCEGTMVLTISMDTLGAVTGTMALEDYSSSCDLLSGAVSAQITDDKDGRSWIEGTAEGIVTAEGTAEVSAACTELRSGYFTVPAWGDAPVAFFDLRR